MESLGEVAWRPIPSVQTSVSVWAWMRWRLCCLSGKGGGESSASGARGEMVGWGGEGISLARLWV
eukprot:4319891-Pyramimonas_sp.AAC.1